MIYELSMLCYAIYTLENIFWQDIGGSFSEKNSKQAIVYPIVNRVSRCNHIVPASGPLTETLTGSECYWTALHEQTNIFSYFILFDIHTI